jgi:hypothetical protein
MSARRFAALLVAGALVAGCGGGGESHRDESAREKQAGGEEAEREAAAKQLDAADRIAYYQLATTAGLLRGEAALARAGRPTSGDPGLRAARQRLGALKPQDRELARLIAPLQDAVDAFVATAPAARRSASGPALAAASAVDAGLKKYLVAHRAAGTLVPD